jgi:hypothetical protein
VKTIYATAATMAVVIALAAPLPAQNRDVYGVWVRGGKYDLKEFPFKGVEVDAKWSKVEPSDGDFDWKDFDARLEKAATLGLYTFVNIGVGPQSPLWLYDKGIPKVMTEGHDKSGPYPYYLDPRHISYYHRLIEEFGRHIRSLPARVAGRIVFVQVKTGSTGDEAPYKGKPTSAEYEIGKWSPEWDNFRLAAFKKFNTAFQEGPGPVIPLLFNCVLGVSEFAQPSSDGTKSLLDWVSKNVKGGWGHKMGGYGQCYQLNDEAERGLEYLSHLIDPAQGVYEFFSRCEMDQGWQRGINAVNIRQGLYWTCLSALHSGLCIWNLSESSREWCRDNDYWEHARFFNNYAGQTHSSEATGAFCALREGLDSADTEKFPEAAFGPAARDNKERYLAICTARAARGAKMDDLNGVLAGHTKRSTHVGLNDAGWQIFRGNYERFLHQIDADKTSVGWWRVGGDVTTTSPIYGRFARGFDHAADKDVMSFDIKDSFFSGKPLAGACPVTVRVVYYDRGKGQWALRYDAVSNPDKTAVVVTKTDSGQWKEESITLADANFGNRAPNGADLVLINTDAEDDVFHMVELSRHQAGEIPPQVQKMEKRD